MQALIHFAPIPAKDALTLVLASVAVVIGLLQYHYTSRSEFLKPVRETQLQLYVEASSAAATLATAPRSSEEWRKANLDFLRLYFGPLAMVEDYRHTVQGDDKNQNVTVEQAMMAFKGCLDDPSCVGSWKMNQLSLALAHTCRVSLGSSWGFMAAQLQGDYQKVIEDKSTEQGLKEKKQMNP
jgi:hypothetical protein